MAIKFPSVEEWNEMAKEYERDIALYKMYGANGLYIGEFIGKADDPACINMGLVLAKEWTMVKRGLLIDFLGIPLFVTKMRRSEQVGDLYLGENLWTCRCPDNFIRSRLIMTCPYCNVPIGNAQKRIKYLKEILRWETFIIDGTKGE